MENKSMNISHEQFNKLLNDVAMIKEFVIPKKDTEGELTDWAKKELAEARKIPDCDLISMEEIEREFL